MSVPGLQYVWEAVSHEAGEPNTACAVRVITA